MTEKVEKCGLSRVEVGPTIKVLSRESQIEHQGSLTHVCVLPKKHTEEYCRCVCNFQWRKFHNE